MIRRSARLAAISALFSLLLALGFSAGYLTRALNERQPGAGGALSLLGGPQYPLLDEARRLLEEHFIGGLPDDRALEHGAVRGLAGAVGDPYTVFVEPPAHELQTQSLQGEYGGIGVHLQANALGEIVLSPFFEGPALEAGLRDGDVLVQVDDTPVRPGTPVDEAAALLRGPVGTSVRVGLRRADGRRETLPIVRQNIPLPSVTYRVLEADPAIGLLAVERFSGKTADELRQAAAELEARGVERLVLDLRNNGGGILEAAVDVAAQFLDGGVIMYETQKNGGEKTFQAPAGRGLTARAPLAVLVNHNTASAAEIVAGALLDRQRAPLIGQTTYGKGSVQLVFELSDGSSLHITSYLWYTPQRRPLDRQGLAPTLPVEPASDGTDAELAAAVDYLQSQP